MPADVTYIKSLDFIGAHGFSSQRLADLYQPTILYQDQFGAGTLATHVQLKEAAVPLNRVPVISFF
jgi:hypothetical protein